MQAQKYAALKKPYLINDMVMQDVLLDRRRVYGKLKVCGADLPCMHMFHQKPRVPRVPAPCIRTG